jgi:diguanylate cyclase (GGDEF)-like protein
LAPRAQRSVTMLDTLSVEKKILMAFIAAVLLLLAAGWFAVESGRAYLAAEAEADRLRDAERAVLAVELSLRRAESGERGYLLTGRQEYLRPYERAIEDIGAQMDETRELLADQPEALAAFWNLDKLVRLKLADLHETIEVRRSEGFDAALRLVNSDVGAIEMRDIRLNIEAIQQQLRARKAAELAGSARRFSNTFLGMIFGGSIVAVLAVAAYLVIAWELRERRQLAARVEAQANQDVLTHLPNRRFFVQWLGFNLAQARRDGADLALMFIDLDGFKAVNDRYGHDAGDALLVEISRRFRHTVRESDLLARVGGDEFALIAPNAKDGSELGQLAQRLLNALSRASARPVVGEPIGASIGIALFPDDAEDLQGLVAAADAAMYAAKRAGKNRFAFYGTSAAATA